MGENIECMIDPEMRPAEPTARLGAICAEVIGVPRTRILIEKGAVHALQVVWRLVPKGQGEGMRRVMTKRGKATASKP